MGQPVETGQGAAHRRRIDACQVAGRVQGFKPENYLPTREARRVPRFAQLAVAAAVQAVAGVQRLLTRVLALKRLVRSNDDWGVIAAKTMALGPSTITGNGKVLWFIEPPASYFVSTFFYKNHAAAYFNVVLALTAGVAVAHPRIEREALWLPPDGGRVTAVAGRALGAHASDPVPAAAHSTTARCRSARSAAGIERVAATK